jgi:hypothetical protein
MLTQKLDFARQEAPSLSLKWHALQDFMLDANWPHRTPEPKDKIEVRTGEEQIFNGPTLSDVKMREKASPPSDAM